MGISLSPFQPGQVIQGGGAPDPLQQLIAALSGGAELGAQAADTQTKERGAASRSALQHEADMANVALRQKEYDLTLADKKLALERQKMLGDALKQILPHMQATGQAQKVVDAIGPEIGLTPGASVPQSMEQPQANAGLAGGGQQDIASVLRSLPAEVLPGIMEHLSQVASIRQQQTRDTIGAKYQPPADESIPGMVNRLKRMSAEYATAGDHAMVASLASDIGAIEPNAMKTDYEWFQKKDGSTVYLPKEQGSKLGLGKPITQSGFGFGPGGPLAVIRGISAVAGLEDADEKMKRFELKVAQAAGRSGDSGFSLYNDFDFFRGQLATMYNDANRETGLLGHVVPFFGTAVGSAVLARLNRTNPDLANYLQAAAQWALEDSQLQGRPSDFRIKMDEFISAIKPDSKVQAIHDIWKSRGVRLAGYQRGVPALKALLDRVTAMPGLTTEVVP